MVPDKSACPRELAHDVKTPLTALKLKLQLAIRILEKPDPNHVGWYRLRNLFRDSISDVDRACEILDRPSSGPGEKSRGHSNGA